MNKEQAEIKKAIAKFKENGINLSFTAITTGGAPVYEFYANPPTQEAAAAIVFEVIKNTCWHMMHSGTNEKSTREFFRLMVDKSIEFYKENGCPQWPQAEKLS